MFSSLNSCLYKHFPLYTHNEYTQTKKKKNSKKAEVRARWPWVGLRAACSQGELKKKRQKPGEDSTLLIYPLSIRHICPRPRLHVFKEKPLSS